MSTKGKVLVYDKILSVLQKIEVLEAPLKVSNIISKMNSLQKAHNCAFCTENFWVKENRRSCISTDCFHMQLHHLQEKNLFQIKTFPRLRIKPLYCPRMKMTHHWGNIFGTIHKPEFC